VGLFRRKKELKHRVELLWNTQGAIRYGKVVVNGEQTGRVSYKKGFDGDFFKGFKPLKGVKSPVEINNFHPFPYTANWKDPEEHKRITQLKRGGIGTEVHRKMEELIKRDYPDTDALIAVVDRYGDAHIQDEEAARTAIKFYKSQGYKLHQKIVQYDDLRDDPMMRERVVNPIRRYEHYIMVKRLEGK